jgi:hypothetical protein
LFCGIARPTAVVLLLKLGGNEVCFAIKKRPQMMICGRRRCSLIVQKTEKPQQSYGLT